MSAVEKEVQLEEMTLPNQESKDSPKRVIPTSLPTPPEPSRLVVIKFRDDSNIYLENGEFQFPPELEEEFEDFDSHLKKVHQVEWVSDFLLAPTKT